MITFFSYQKDRVNKRLWTYFIVILRSLIIDGISFTDELFKSLPPRYIHSLHFRMDGGAQKCDSNFNSIFKSISKFKELHHLVIPNIPRNIESNTNVIQYMNKFEHLTCLEIISNTISPRMLCSILVNLKSTLTTITLFNIWINSDVMDAIRTSTCCRYLNFLQLHCLFDLAFDLPFESLKKLLLSKAKTLNKFYLLINELTLKQHMYY